MNKYDDIKKEIERLFEEGKRLHNGLTVLDDVVLDKRKSLSDKDEKDMYFFIYDYEVWYTASLHIIKNIIPDRVNDFVFLYRGDKRKEITWQNYTISDAIQAKTSSSHSFHPGCASYNLLQQVSIVKSCLDKFDKKVYDIQLVLQADIFDSEIESAKHLHKLGFLRAAGAICGVVIEKHFAGVSDAHNIAIKKKNPTISDFNDKFKDVVYDTIEWRRIQRLGDIRNLCDHNKDREPTPDEVLELISGTERTIKTIF